MNIKVAGISLTKEQYQIIIKKIVAILSWDSLPETQRKKLIMEWIKWNKTKE